MFYISISQSVRKLSLSRCLPSSERTLKSVFWVAQGDSQALVCGCSRFQTVAREWEKREKRSQIKHNAQEMSQNTCERSGVRKYKLRVQYFLSHYTKENSHSGERKTWNFMVKLRTKDSVLLKLLFSHDSMMFQKIFSELTPKLSGGLLLLQHQIEKLFISFC